MEFTLKLYGDCMKIEVPGVGVRSHFGLFATVHGVADRPVTPCTFLT